MKSQTNNMYYRKIGVSIIVSFRHINRINVINSKEVEHELINLLKKRVSTMFLDLTGINFIDSTGFKILLEIQKFALEKHINFILFNVDEEVLELINLVKLGSTFKIEKSKNIIPVVHKMAS